MTLEYSGGMRGYAGLVIASVSHELRAHKIYSVFCVLSVVAALCMHF